MTTGRRVQIPAFVLGADGRYKSFKDVTRADLEHEIKHTELGGRARQLRATLRLLGKNLVASTTMGDLFGEHAHIAEHIADEESGDHGE